MIEKKCEYCGKVMTTGQVKKGNRFCSTKCASLGVYEADVDRDYPWERLPGRMWKCRYVESGEIACRVRRCSKCGWNPDVAKARNESIRNKQTEGNEELDYGKVSSPA